MADQFEEICNTIRRVMLSIIAFTLYCLITISKSDMAMFRSEGVTLPFAETRVAYISFLYVAPLILVGLTLYLHIFIERHYEKKSPNIKNCPPYLFNFEGPLSTAITWVLFYGLPPLLIFVFYIKARPHPWSYALLILAIITATLLMSASYHRRESGYKNRSSHTDSFNFSIFSPLSITTVSILCLALMFIFDEMNYPIYFKNTIELFNTNIKGLNLSNYKLSDAKFICTSDCSDSIIDCDFSRASLRSAEFDGPSLKKIKLIGAKLQDAEFKNLSLEKVDFNDAKLQSAKFEHVSLKGVEFNSAKLQDAEFNDVSFEEVIFGDAKLQDATFKGHIDLRKANFKGTDLTGTIFEGADLSYAILEKATLNDAKLNNANLIWAEMNHIEGRHISLRSATMINAKMKNSDLSFSDLGNTSLKGAALEGAQFVETTLSGSCLSGAKLAGATLTRAHLEYSDFADWEFDNTEKSKNRICRGIYQYLCEDYGKMVDEIETDRENSICITNHGAADLENTNLVGASLQGANLEGVNFEGANLEGANLQGANLENARLFNANLDGVGLTDLALQGADIRGARGIECEELRKAKGWSLTFRDHHLKCGGRMMTKGL